MEAASFLDILKRYPFIKESMEHRMRTQYTDKWKKFVKKSLRMVDYFSFGVSDKILEEMIYSFELVNIKEGDYLFKAGEQVTCIYFVVDGELDIYVENHNKEFYIDTLYQGCNVGAYSMIRGEDYTNHGKARSDLTLIKLSQNKLIDFRDKFESLDETILEYEQYLEENGLPY
jgi:CRP-like cAMP-binding protein